ncbi:MAG: hypothetical protein O7E57_09925 [Gammaproteobacteria bacterium]|nr:hypothetical protein [Gammaproteobacteria bacterium]
MTNRRELLIAGALVGTAPVLAARPAYSGPNVIIVRFGGGVRRRETIDPAHTYAPYLSKSLTLRGTLFSNMEVSEIKDVTTTSHAQGTLYLLTGRYDAYKDIEGQFLSERFEPAAPTLFEYLRKTYDVPTHQCLIVNGEDRKNEEYFTFSNHDLYGVDYRCHTLSLARFKRYLFRQQISEGELPESELAKTRKTLAELERLDYRNAEPLGQGEKLDTFWRNWRAYYGDSGFVNARGDALLTRLAVRALDTLAPKLMMINYQDPDYVHWGNPSHYTRGISIIDRGLESLIDAVQINPTYRGNTIFVIVPDCGRDSNRFQRIPFQHHFNSRSAHEIWALLVGPGIPRGRSFDHRVDQTDVTATIGALMGMATSEVEGRVLI